MSSTQKLQHDFAANTDQLLKRVTKLLGLSADSKNASKRLRDATIAAFSRDLSALLHDYEDSDGEVWGWSVLRAAHNIDEKTLIAEHFAEHDFLVPTGESPTQDRNSVAAILVTAGTSPNVVVEKAVHWIKEHPAFGPFDITWFTPGGRVAATIRHMHRTTKMLRSATQLFLFPGLINEDQEAVTGPEPVRFAEGLERGFTYAFLGAYSFDIYQGNVHFHYSSEIDLQKSCATLRADHKFLFLDSSKFRTEGQVGYNLRELLQTCKSFSVYTVASENDAWLLGKFDDLCDSLLSYCDVEGDIPRSIEEKSIRLVIVGRGNRPTMGRVHQGVLRSSDE